MKKLLIVLTASCALLSGSLGAHDLNNATGTSGLIMIDKIGKLIRFFDPTTLKEISTLAIEGTPHELAISPDHKTAYVPNYGDGVYGRNPNPGHSIAIIDLDRERSRARSMLRHIRHRMVYKSTREGFSTPSAT